jgi:hypothetical protein
MTPLANTKAAAATVSVAAAAPLLLGPARAAEVPDTTPPTGRVLGLHTPVAGTLELSLQAEDSGSGLASAQATLDTQNSTAQLSGSASSALFSLDTRALADGTHDLIVRVTDVAANTATLVDRPIFVRNAPPPPTGTTATATIGVAFGNGGGGAGKGNGGGKGKGGGKGPPCHRPKLKMRLAKRPLWRTRPGRLPVLRFRHRHLYRGRLTCMVGGKRVSAPDGAKVQIYYRIWRRSFRKHRGPITVRKGAIRVRGGRLRVRLGFLSGRTIVFRYRSPEGEAASVKLRIAIARTDPPRQGQ